MTVPQSVWSQMAPEPAIPRALAHFGVLPSSIESVAVLVSRAGHDVYRVRAQGSDWVLKGHRSPAVEQRLRTSHRLQLRLADHGFPVAPLQQSESGQTLVQEDSALYSLHPWVDGQQFSIADREEQIVRCPRLVGEFATMIGTLHAISRDLEDTGSAAPEGDPDRVFRGLRQSALALRRPRPLHLSHWHALRLKPAKSEFDRWIIRVLPGVAAQADRIASQSIAQRIGASGMGVVHDDINWENLVFDDDLHVRALLDFDNATRAPWALEVGAAAVVLVGAEPRRVEEFVATYEATSGVEVDRAIVKLAMEAKCVRSILTSVSTYLNGDTDLTLRAPWCDDLHESLQKLTRE